MFLCCLIAHLINGSESSSSLQSPDLPEMQLQRNQLGAFSTIRHDSSQNGRPSFAASFESLSTENGKAGFFNTALQRTVKLNDFKVDFFRYSSESNSVGLKPNLETQRQSNHDQKTDFGKVKKVSIEQKPATLKDVFKQCLGKSLVKGGVFSGKKQDFSVNDHVDFNNISKLSVTDFQYNRFFDEELEFSLTCKKAETSDDQSVLSLRGHVVITTGNGSKLETNRVFWDMNNETFQVKGNYFLNHNGTFKTGRNTCFDVTLKEHHSGPRKALAKSE